MGYRAVKLGMAVLAAVTSPVALAQQTPQPAQAPVPATFFNALHWRLIGPFRAGRVVAVAGVPGSATQYLTNIGVCAYGHRTGSAPHRGLCL